MRANGREWAQPSVLAPLALGPEEGDLPESVRGFGSRLSAAGQIARARAFGFRMATAWWRTLTSSDRAAQPLRELFEPVDSSVLTGPDGQAADDLGAAAARLHPDAAAYQIGVAYTSMLPREHRAAHGIYYTPPSLVKRLMDQATSSGVDWRTARVLDPASGGGAFLAPVARRIVEEVADCSPRILVENLATRLQGYEIDPFGAWLSQVTLDAALLPITREARKRLPVVVTVCDSLRTGSVHEQFDLVIGNPPYGRVRLDALTRSVYQRSLYGHANMYGLFTDLALRQAKPGGIIAYVTPTSFLAGEYFKNLRALLAHEAPPATVDFIAVRKGIFENVLQETLLATYRRGDRPRPIKVHEISPAGGEKLTVKRAGTIALPPDPSQPWMLPRQSLQAPLVGRLASMRNRLADWGYAVSTGPLVWNRHKDQLVSRPGGKRFPLIWAEAVTSDGRFIWRADKKNHTPYFEAREGDDWLITNSLCVLVQRTTAKEQTRRLIAAALPAKFVFRHGAVVIENHLNMVRSISKRPPVHADVLAAFLNSAAADRAFRCVSGSVAVSAYELEAMPLPAVDDLGPVARLVQRGATRDRIEAACTRLYDGTG